MMLGSPTWGKICDTFGRKICLFFCTVFTFTFGLLSSFSPSFIYMLVFRGLVGFGIGGAPQAVTLCSEFLPLKQRAKSVAFSMMFWSIGACLEVLLAILIMPTLGWKWLLGISACPLLIFICLCFWLPESARFHVISNKSDQALKTLKRIAYENKVGLPEGDLELVKVRSGVC
jgi:MFS family permease